MDALASVKLDNKSLLTKKILPKEGKDIKDKKNWRPTTLSNCDAKIITKALAMRMSNVLDEIIVNPQTGYVKGRILRILFYYRIN